MKKRCDGGRSSRARGCSLRAPRGREQRSSAPELLWSERGEARGLMALFKSRVRRRGKCNEESEKQRQRTPRSLRKNENTMAHSHKKLKKKTERERGSLRRSESPLSAQQLLSSSAQKQLSYFLSTS